MSNLELHYYLEDNRHSMNALVKNKCDSELLKLYSHIALLLDIELEIEVEAITPGGLKEVVKFFSRKKNKHYLIILMFIAPILSGVIINVSSNEITEDSELTSLVKEEKRLTIKEKRINIERQQLELKQLKKKLESDSIAEVNEALGNIKALISRDYRVRTFKSRFYSQLMKETSVYQFSITELTDDGNGKSKEATIAREFFQAQVLDEDTEVVIVENAYVQIVSPVLKPGDMRWRAIYNGKDISFNLLDADFKNSVLNRQYSFSNGTSILCKLELKQAVNANGDLYYKEVNVYDVLEVFDGLATTSTNKSRQLKEIANQTRIEFKD